MMGVLRQNSVGSSIRRVFAKVKENLLLVALLMITAREDGVVAEILFVEQTNPVTRILKGPTPVNSPMIAAMVLPNQPFFVFPMVLLFLLVLQ